MNTLKEAIQDLAAISKRGAITEEELGRLLGYLVESSSTRQPSSVSASPPATLPMGSKGPTRRRRFEGRGKYGWVDPQCAKTLDLVALLKLGGSASRAQVLDLIERQWGQYFTEDDRQMLPIAPEPRWKKTCHWAFYYLHENKLTERPRRGLQSLTEAGKREAEARMKDLPK